MKKEEELKYIKKHSLALIKLARNNPEIAKKILVEAGIYQPDGKLSKIYQ